MRRLLTVTVVFAAALLPAATAQAAPAIAVQLARPDVRYGAAHTLTGTLSDGAAPLAGQVVVLEGQRYPFHGSYREIARTTTDAAGAFAFKPVLDRNHRLRVVAPGPQLLSPSVHAYVLPSFELSFRAIKPGVVRLYQRYTVPGTVKLGQPTFFYLGARHAKHASRRVEATTKRTSSGRYTARATITLPMAWKGAFQYGSCFRTTPGSGMGEPGASCPKVALRF